MKLKTFTGCLILFLRIFSLGPCVVRCPLAVSLSPFSLYDAFSQRKAPNEKRTKRHLDRPESVSLLLTRRAGRRLISRWLIKNSFVFVAGTNGAAHLRLARHVEKWIHACGSWNRVKSETRDCAASSAYTKENLAIKFIGLGNFFNRLGENQKLLFMNLTMLCFM